MKGRFTRLVLKNWRNFKDVDVELRDRVFVVGPNAAGKSNLLDVFRFLRELAVDGGGLSNALNAPNRRGFRTVRSLHAGKQSDLVIQVGVELDGHHYTYRLCLVASGTAKKPGPAKIKEERVVRDGEDILRRPDAADEQDHERLEATAIEQRSANARFRELRDFFRSIEYIHVVPQVVRRPQEDDLDRFGKGLGTGLVEAIHATKPKTRDARLRRITKALSTVLPEFVKLDSVVDAGGRPHLEAGYRHWRKDAAKQRESEFSDGTLRLIGLLWYLSAGDAPLLLEEPELSLHPAAVRQIPRMLGSVAARSERQILMSSHSPELLGNKGIDPSEVLLLTTRGNAGTNVVVGSSLTELVNAAKAGLALGPYIEALTRPERIEDLASFGSDA